MGKIHPFYFGARKQRKDVSGGRKTAGDSEKEEERISFAGNNQKIGKRLLQEK